MSSLKYRQLNSSWLSNDLLCQTDRKTTFQNSLSPQITTLSSLRQMSTIKCWLNKWNLKVFLITPNSLSNKIVHFDKIPVNLYFSLLVAHASHWAKCLMWVHLWREETFNVSPAKGPSGWQLPLKSNVPLWGIFPLAVGHLHSQNLLFVSTHDCVSERSTV